MALFGKKNCDVCGGKIGLLGNRKLDDGNLCKECAKQLSPFFSERRRSTVADIKSQLEYREENKAAVAAFNVTRTLGLGTKVMLDEDAGKFIVSSAKRWQDANPDVLDYSMVTGVNLKIDESQEELTQEDKDGKEVSYNPPRKVYRYDFWITINVNHPYFNDIKFRINSSSIDVESRGTRFSLAGGSDIGNQSVEYRQCEEIANEIKEALTQVREGVRESVAAANAPKVAQTCSYCGATTMPDAQGRCEFCGGALS